MSDTNHANRQDRITDDPYAKTRATRSEADTRTDDAISVPLVEESLDVQVVQRE